MNLSSSLSPSSILSKRAGAVLTRYEQAYLLTEMYASLATGLRWGAKVVLVVAVIVTAGLELNDEWWLSLFPMAVGVTLGVMLFLSAILVAAAGQFLTASLDTAVHTSPFLDDEQRAKVMLL